MKETSLNLVSNRCDGLNIGIGPREVNGINAINSGINPTFTGINPFASVPMTVTGIGTGTALPPNAVGSGVNQFQQVGSWIPAKTAAGDFLKIQYAEVEVRCAITRKMVPAGSPIMLLGGMVISQEAFENWLEEHLSAMICRHTDMHKDNSGYDE